MTVLKVILFYFALLAFTFLMMVMADAQLPRQWQEQQLPPKKYDHDYDGDLTILRASEPEVRKA